MLIPDFDTKLFLDALPKIAPLWDVSEVVKAEQYIRERAEMVRAGVRRCPSWFQEELNALDSRMRAWWDDWRQEWILDRRQDEGFYLTVIRFRPTPDLQLDSKLIEALRANDMQRQSVAENLAKKNAAAEAQEKANEKAGDEIVAAAVDSLSSKSLETMAKVLTAIQTGETIVAHGDDAKFLQRVEDERKKAPKRPRKVK